VWCVGARGYQGANGGCGARVVRAARPGGLRVGASLPPNVLVAHKYGGHGQGRGEGGLELDGVAFRGRLLEGDDLRLESGLAGGSVVVVGLGVAHRGRRRSRAVLTQVRLAHVLGGIHGDWRVWRTGGVVVLDDGDAATWRWRRGFATLHPQSAPGLAACSLLLGGRCSAAAQWFCPTVILAGTSRSEELSGGWAMLRSPVADTERPPRSWSLRIHPIRNRFPTCSRRQRSPASSSDVSGAADRRICEQYHRLVLRG